MSESLELFVVAFTTFFATVGPVDVAAVFAGLTGGITSVWRRRMAVRGVLAATGILLVFALCGQPLLKILGISLPALKVAGGILLFLMSIDMVFARSSGGTSTTSEERDEARLSSDISIFPLATPLLAGPGAMGAAILLMSRADSVWPGGFIVLAALLAVMVLTLVLLLAADGVHRLLGITGLHVITRVMGVLLAALAVQFVFDGLQQSPLLGTGYWPD